MSEPNPILDSCEQLVNCMSFVSSMYGLRCNSLPMMSFATAFLAAGGETGRIRLIKSAHIVPGLQDLCEQIRDCGTVSTLCFECHGDPDPDFLKAIAACKSNTSSEKELILSNCNVTFAEEELFGLLSSLTELNVFNSVGILCRLWTAQWLRSLKLQCNNVGPQGMKMLVANSSLWEQLEELAIKNEEVGLEGAKTLGRAWAGSNRCNLRYLTLSDQSIKSAGILSIVEGLLACKNLPLKEFSACICGIDAEGAETLARMIRGTPGLEYVDISGNYLGEGTSIGESLKGCATKLRQLNMSYCGFGQKTVGDICRSLALGALEGLNIGSSAMQENEAKMIADLLLPRGLVRLKMRTCKIDTEGALCLAAGIAKNRTLQLLDLSNNRSMRKVGLVALLDAFSTDYPIEKLKLAYCELGDLEAMIVGRLMLRTRRLYAVSVADNEIGLAGLKAIAEAAEGSSALRKLSIGGNKFGAEGAKCIAEKIINGCRPLILLNISGIQMGAEGTCEVIDAILRLRIGVTRLRYIIVNVSDCGGKERAKALRKAGRSKEISVFG